LKRIVLDASVMLGAHLPDEQVKAAVGLFRTATGMVFHVPQIWHVELGNAMLMAVRRNRIPASTLDSALEKLAGLIVTVDALTGEKAWFETIALAQKHRMTLYDAAYLELALRLNAQLATLDERLAEAARLEDVELTL
jgi:predicted nucleic acid-binding protein